MSTNPDDWLSNIPAELQAIPQWMVCYDDKVPKSVGDNIHPKDPTNPQNWSPFVNAYMYAIENRMHIGFCLSESDPFTIIDVDGKSGLPEHLENVRRFYQQAQSYVERSMSGKGIHIIMYGSIGDGRRNGNIELYDRDRFMILTGDVMGDMPLPIVRDDEWLSGLVQHCQSIAHTFELDEPPDPRNDPQIWQQIDNSPSRNQFAKLWIHQGPFNSELDFNFCCILAEFVENSDQAWRIFQMTPMGVDHARRHPESHYACFFKQTWPKARAKVLAERAVGTMAMNAANKLLMPPSNVLQFPQRPQLPPPAPSPIFHTKLAQEVLNEQPVEWMLENVFQTHSVNTIYGSSGAGKSFIALDLAFAVAKGSDWFGHETKQANVLYMALEGGEGLRNRLQAYQYGRGGVPANVEFYRGKFSLLNPLGVGQFIAARRSGGNIGELIIIDTFIRAIPGADENSNSEMQQAIESLEKIRDELQACVIVVHHSTKDGAKIRGASAIYNGVDGSLEVRKEFTEAGEYVGRFVHMNKVREEATLDGLPFELKQLQIGQHQRKSGEWVKDTSCVVDYEAVPWSKDESGETPIERTPKRKAPPKHGARSEREYRTSVNETNLISAWPALAKIHGEWVPMWAVEDWAKAYIAGTKDSNKLTTLGRVLTKLQDQKRLECKGDGNGGQLVKLH